MLTLLSTAILVAGSALSIPMSFAVSPQGEAFDDTKVAMPTNSTYIVRMMEEPVVAYTGNIKGYPATKLKKGQKINPLDAKVINYMAYLSGRHDTALKSVGGGKKHYDYGYVLNGFAADLTPAQAKKLASTAGVLAVEKDEAHLLDTSTTPTFLGLNTATTGLWNRAGGVGKAGENVIIGIVDGGAWPEHPSYSDRTGANGNASQDGKLSYQQIPGWHGKCVPGENFTATNCNQKLIGARYYNAGFGGNEGIDTDYPYEFNSPRDFGGHGTHTSTTAGGNNGVPATGEEAVFGAISGIAPRARIAVYKTCWQTPAGGSCFSSDSVMAIDQAVADGVDVINYSISGSRTNFLDSVEVAFLRAADAGVFVSASAGNSGPTVSTVAHPGPWLTTVANSSHNRNGEGSVTLGNGATYTGAAYTPALASKPLVRARDVKLPAASLASADLCFSSLDNAGVPVLDPALAAGKIIICERGTNVLVNKSFAVLEATGAGMVLVNTPTSAATLFAIVHSVPSVHLPVAAYAPIQAYVATPSPTAAINASTVTFTTPAPIISTSSSRGPLTAGGGDLLKPDVTAPGSDVLAGVAPPGNAGKLFALYSGTSMSSPHVAGLGALFKQLKPGWSPMAIKSALMTTGGDVLDGPNTNPLVIFRQGAGHVTPNAAFDPGLVFDSDANDWIAMICGTNPTAVDPATCAALVGAGYSTDVSNMNVASIAIGDMPGTQTVRRRVTNVGGSSATYTIAATGLTGITFSASPSNFTIAPGATQVVDFTFTRTTAAIGSYVGGQIRFTDGTHTVRIPAVIRPILISVPAEATGTYNATFGYTGAFTATARGMVPAATTPGTVADDPTDGACSLTAPNAVLIPITVQAGSTYIRLQLFDADVNPGSDIDLCVVNAGGTVLATSASGTSAESISGTLAAGNYTAVVHGWGVVGSSPFVFHFWDVGSTNAGNMTVVGPASAVAGTTSPITISFVGPFAPATKYLGTVAYTGIAGLPSPTVIRYDNP